MNIQNIASLSAQLTAIGFEHKIGLRLLQQACFQPAQFILTEKMVKGKDLLTCTLYFERKGEEYSCHYYDACLLKEVELPSTVLEDVAVLELDQRMGKIVWMPDAINIEAFQLEQEETWEREREIEKVVSELSRLSSSVEGKYYADCLKLKHWAELPLPFALGNLQSLKSRMEVNQRFYFLDGKGISLDEAYRFLLNRWMEKNWAAKKKAGGNVQNERDKNKIEHNGSLLPKKRSKLKK